MVSHSVVKVARIAIPIHGVTCWGSDAALIKGVLSAVDGVASVYVNPVMEMVYLHYDPARCGVSELVAALVQSGFEPGEASIRSFE